MMDSKQVDDLLLTELRYARCGSKLRTSLGIRLADHASNLNGFRSSRQIPGDKKDEVEESSNKLMDRLIVCSYEYEFIIEDNNHTYKSVIYEMSSDEIELVLENCLFDSIIHSNFRDTFKQFFLV